LNYTIINFLDWVRKWRRIWTIIPKRGTTLCLWICPFQNQKQHV